MSDETPNRTNAPATKPPRFRVCASDAFMDPDDEQALNSYATFEEARAAAERMVQRELLHLYQPGMSAERWLEDYMDFGDDPWIRPCPTKEGGRPIFSAWDYAEEMTKRWIAKGVPTKRT